MSKDTVDRDKLKILKEQATQDTQIIMEEEVYIIVTQAFCPNGHNLVGKGRHTFDGYPSITIKVSDGSQESLVELSPFHGDSTKFGMEYPAGTKLSLMCPECGVELPAAGPCQCEDVSEGEWRKVYLTPERSESHVILLCDIWGCPHSKVIDNNDLFSEFAPEDEEDVQ